MKIGQSPKMTVRIEAVAVAAKAEVLQSMKTRQRIAVVEVLRFYFGHEVAATKHNVFGAGRKRADVEDLDFTKYGNMGNKAVDTRGDVDVPLWVSREDALCNNEVLVEIMSGRRSALDAVVPNARIKLSKFHPGTRVRLQRPKLAQVAAEPDQTMDRPRHTRQVDPDQTK